MIRFVLRADAAIKKDSILRFFATKQLEAISKFLRQGSDDRRVHKGIADAVSEVLK